MNSMKKQKDRILKEEHPRSVGAQFATADQWSNNSRKNEETEPKQNKHLVVDVTGDRGKIWCYKEQHCIGTWNVKSMIQGKLAVVKQEMVRVNIDISGISEQRWTGMGEFNSDDYYIYNCGQESLWRNGVALIVHNRVQNEVFECSLKNGRMFSALFALHGKPFNITVIQVYALTTEKAMAPHSSTLAWKIPWMKEPGRLQSMGSLRVRHDRTTSLSLFTFMHWRRKWQPTPMFLPGESQGRWSLVGFHLWGRTESDMTEVT